MLQSIFKNVKNVWERVFPSKDTLESHEMTNVSDFTNNYEYKPQGIDFNSIEANFKKIMETITKFDTTVVEEVNELDPLDLLINVINPPTLNLFEPEINMIMNEITINYIDYPHIDVPKISIVEQSINQKPKITFTVQFESTKIFINKIIVFLCNLSNKTSSINVNQPKERKKMRIENQYILFDNG